MKTLLLTLSFSTICLFAGCAGMAYHPGYSFDWETGSYWPSDQKAYDAYMLAHPDVLKKTNKEGGFPYYGKF